MRIDKYANLMREYVEENKLNEVIDHVGLKYYGYATIMEMGKYGYAIQLEDGTILSVAVDKEKLKRCPRLRDVFVNDKVTVSYDSWDGIVFRSLGEVSAYRCNDMELDTMLEFRDKARLSDGD